MSDESYSIWPTIALDKTTSTLHSVLTYSPGFTFYQHTSGRNEADQNVAINVQYRLTPHLTLSGRDSFQKSSSVFNQPDLGSGLCRAEARDLTVRRLHLLLISFAPRGMSGPRTNSPRTEWSERVERFRICTIRIPRKFPGFLIQTPQAGSVFYSLRATKMHYFGVTYQYQRLVVESRPKART